MGKATLPWFAIVAVLTGCGVYEATEGQRTVSSVPIRITRDSSNLNWSIEDAIAAMRRLRAIYVRAGSNIQKMPPYARHLVGDESSRKPFIIPNHTDAAMYFMGYYDPRCEFNEDGGHCSPVGGITVLFKNGDAKTFDGKAARILYAKTRPTLVFEGMKGYPPKKHLDMLPKLPEYEPPLYTPLPDFPVPRAKSVH